jgi:hypothetical protein
VEALRLSFGPPMLRRLKAGIGHKGCPARMPAILAMAMRRPFGCSLDAISNRPTEAATFEGLGCSHGEYYTLRL